MLKMPAEASSGLPAPTEKAGVICFVVGGSHESEARNEEPMREVAPFGTSDRALGFFRSFNFEKPALNEAVSRYGGDVMTLEAMGKVFPYCCPNDLPHL
jgi:hypothetical protein